MKILVSRAFQCLKEVPTARGDLQAIELKVLQSQALRRCRQLRIGLGCGEVLDKPVFGWPLRLLKGFYTCICHEKCSNEVHTPSCHLFFWHGGLNLGHESFQKHC